MRKITLFVSSFTVMLFFTACNAMLAKMSGQSYTPAHSYHQSSIAAQLLSIEQKWKNTPYRLGGVSVNGADCSGFIQTVFKEHFHTQIPRTTVTQQQGGKKIARNELKSGDIMFFKTGRGPHGLHTGIYVENDEFIHLSTGGGVKKVSLNSRYWKTKFIGARRYIQ